MKRLSLLDLGFFITESHENPKHVAGLMVFKRPPKGGADFARKLYEELRNSRRPTEPFNQVINFRAIGGPGWKTAEDFDIDEHVFYHNPRKVITDMELHELAARLHTPMLDRSRPLWEFHVIDGVKGGRFAIYSKIHHAYADGVTLTAWTARSLSEDKSAKNFTPVWTLPRRKRPRRRTAPTTAVNILKGFLRGSITQFRAARGLTKLIAQLALERFGVTRNAVSLPFRSEGDTPLTGQVTGDRQLAVAKVPMEDVQRIRTMCRATLNHVALTCVDGALHKFLQRSGNDLHRPIAIQMPVSLRAEGDQNAGNRIGIVTVDLANRTNDPYMRLREIGFTLRNVRNQIDGVPPDSVVQYTIIMGVAAQLIEMLKLNNALPPISDTLVSNVPGPKKPLYLNGALMEEMCPVSTLMPGNHLNITLYSYAGTLHFGLIGTRQLGDLEVLASNIERAFVDLEAAVFNPRYGSDRSGA